MRSSVSSRPRWRQPTSNTSRNDLEPTHQGPSNFGLRMDVDFSVFERLAIFGRGETLLKRTRRLIRSGGRLREVQVPTYQRLVMIMKLRPHRRLGRHVQTDSVYLQLFKNIPKLDVHMLLPGARVRINQLDLSKIGFSLVSGLALTVWRILQEISHGIEELFLFQHPLALWGIAAGAIGYGARSYFGYQQTKQRYNLSLTQILYFQNLDTNAGVIHRLVDEAREQQLSGNHPQLLLSVAPRRPRGLDRRGAERTRRPGTAAPGRSEGGYRDWRGPDPPG